MSGAIQPAITFGESAWAERSAQSDTRKFARRLCQALVLLPLFSLIPLPEYVQGLGDPETKSIVYRASVGPLRVVDVLLLGIIAVHGFVWAISRTRRLHFPHSLAAPGLGFLGAIAIGMIYGGLHGGTNLFFDWRALALGVGMYGVFAAWAQTPVQARTAIYLFAGYMALRIGLIYASFLMGGGDVIVGVRIPVFDGPTLSAIVFTAVLALLMSDHAGGAWRKLAWTSLSAASYLLVLLCFRRTFWAELGVATALMLLLQKRRRGLKLLLMLATVVTVAVIPGPDFYERMRSMDFTTGESEFSQGNPDHVGEVLDAWEQVQRQPLLGIGLGRSYPTLRIQDWKEESVMVHNAPLHVWLKYGLMGLGCYVWFHFRLFRWLRRRYAMAAHSERTGLSAEFEQSRAFTARLKPYPFTTSSLNPVQPFSQPMQSLHQPWLGAALVYLAAQFAVSLGFTPWPYSSVQCTILIAFILAVAIKGTTQCKFQHSL